jgi:hypothetical protein
MNSILGEYAAEKSININASRQQDTTTIHKNLERWHFIFSVYKPWPDG